MCLISPLGLRNARVFMNHGSTSSLSSETTKDNPEKKNSYSTVWDQGIQGLQVL